MSKKYRLTDRGLTIVGELTYDEWKEIGASLGRHYSGIQWAIGDWMLAIPRLKTWQETFNDACDIVPYSWETLRTHRTVAEAFKHADRGIGLSWSYCRLTIPLDPDKRMQALRDALDIGVSYAEFIEWVESRMRTIPEVRLRNPTKNAARRPGRPRRDAGEVKCPRCGHHFRVKVEERKPDLVGAA